MEKNNVASVCLFLQLLKLRVQKMFIKKELKKYTWQQNQFHLIVGLLRAKLSPT